MAHGLFELIYGYMEFKNTLYNYKIMVTYSKPCYTGAPSSPALLPKREKGADQCKVSTSVSKQTSFLMGQPWSAPVHIFLREGSSSITACSPDVKNDTALEKCPPLLLATLMVKTSSIN